MTDWQPIETAPKDGTEILVRLVRAGCPRHLVVHHCDFVEDHPPIDSAWYFWTGYQFAPVQSQPTHWMPLPDPPKRSTDG